MTRDEFLVEKFGECWHEADPYKLGCKCKCGKNLARDENRMLNDVPTISHLLTANLDLNTDSGFRWLWGKMREDYNTTGSLWDKFEYYCSIRYSSMFKLIDNPSAFADKCAEFFGWKGEE